MHSCRTCTLQSVRHTSSPSNMELDQYQDFLASGIAIMILTEFMDFVVLFKVAIVAIFPNVATAGIKERVVTPAIRELDAAVGSVRHGGLGLNDWFQYAHR